MRDPGHDRFLGRAAPARHAVDEKGTPDATQEVRRSHGRDHRHGIGPGRRDGRARRRGGTPERPRGFRRRHLARGRLRVGPVDRGRASGGVPDDGGRLCARRRGRTDGPGHLPHRGRRPAHRPSGGNAARGRLHRRPPAPAARGDAGDLRPIAAGGRCAAGVRRLLADLRGELPLLRGTGHRLARGPGHLPPQGPSGHREGETPRPPRRHAGAAARRAHLRLRRRLSPPPRPARHHDQARPPGHQGQGAHRPEGPGREEPAGVRERPDLLCRPARRTGLPAHLRILRLRGEGEHVRRPARRTGPGAGHRPHPGADGLPSGG